MFGGNHDLQSGEYQVSEVETIGLALPIAPAGMVRVVDCTLCSDAVDDRRAQVGFHGIGIRRTCGFVSAGELAPNPPPEGGACTCASDGCLRCGFNSYE